MTIKHILIVVSFIVSSGTQDYFPQRCKYLLVGVRPDVIPKSYDMFGF